jgi:hypothetical protein
MENTFPWGSPGMDAESGLVGIFGYIMLNSKACQLHFPSQKVIIGGGPGNYLLAPAGGKSKM